MCLFCVQKFRKFEGIYSHLGNLSHLFGSKFREIRVKFREISVKFRKFWLKFRKSRHFFALQKCRKCWTKFRGKFRKIRGKVVFLFRKQTFTISPKKSHQDLAIFQKSPLWWRYFKNRHSWWRFFKKSPSGSAIFQNGKQNTNQICWQFGIAYWSYSACMHSTSDRTVNSWIFSTSISKNH